jgi:hypothetical protein
VTRRPRGLLRSLSGVLVGGLVALALVLLAGWLYADRAGLPGPGPGMLVGHGVAAAAAVAAQIGIDRHDGPAATAAAAGLAALVTAGLTLVWLF